MGAVQYFGNGECPRSSRRRSRTRGHVGTRVRRGFPANPTVLRFWNLSGGPIFFPRACDRGTIPGRLTDVDILSPLPSQPLRFTWALRLPSAWASASSRAPCGRYVDPPTHRPARPARCSDYENIRDFPANLSPSPFLRNHRTGTGRHAPSRRRTSRASRRSKRGTNPRA